MISKVTSPPGATGFGVADLLMDRFVVGAAHRVTLVAVKGVDAGAAVFTWVNSPPM